MRKTIIFVLFAAMIATICVLFYQNRIIEEVDMASAQGVTVVMNEYASEKWNGGYGHYDLTFKAHDGEGFICNLNGNRVECNEITLSYGAMNGDESPARVDLYTGARTDHRPLDRRTLYERLSYNDFNRFMVWFMRDFTYFEGKKGGVYVYRVADDEFAYYSLSGEKNCLTAAQRMLKELPV